MVVDPEGLPSRVDWLPLKVHPSEAKLPQVKLPLTGVTTSVPPDPVLAPGPLPPDPPPPEPPLPPVLLSTGLTPAHPNPAATANDRVTTDIRLGKTRERIGLLRRLGAAAAGGVMPVPARFLKSDYTARRLPRL